MRHSAHSRNQLSGEEPMTITLDQLNKLSKCETASWAVWSPEFNKRGCMEGNRQSILPYIASRVGELKNNVILLGLNRSFNARKHAHLASTGFPPFANFHSESHAGDGFLKTTVSEFQNLRGAYMTDLCLDQESNSTKVRIVKSVAIRKLDDQLKILAARRFHVVCFGHAVFNALSNHSQPTQEIIHDGMAIKEVELTANSKLSCYRMIHYSYAVRYNHKVRFREQMKHVNDLIGSAYE